MFSQNIYVLAVFCGVGYGYAVANGVESCTECPERQYKNAAGNTLCSPCPDSFTTSGTGRSECTECEYLLYIHFRSWVVSKNINHRYCIESRVIRYSQPCFNRAKPRDSEIRFLAVPARFRNLQTDLFCIKHRSDKIHILK